MRFGEDAGVGVTGLHISYLGPLRVRRGGDDVDVGWRLRRLLAALAVAHGDVVSVDRLVEIVWAGDPPDAAERTLPTYVTRLRRAVGRPDLIISRPPGYVLQLDDGELDSLQFERELDEALRLLGLAEHDDAAVVLERALGRWRGAALAGYDDEEWARPEAVRLEERRFAAREALIEAFLGAGGAQRACADAQALVEEAPLRERPRELLMRALYSSGRQADALREFQQYRSVLADETGLEPSHGLVDLEERIVRSDTTLLGPARSLRNYRLGPRIGEGGAAVVHRATQPSIGREVAIKIIRSELADDEDFIRNFEREARAIGAIEHPNIVPLYDFWREPGAAYLVMRLMQGGSLEDRVRSVGRLDVRELVDVVYDIGAALAAAHAVGVVHGNVGARDVLRDDDGTAHLGDFGVAGALLDRRCRTTDLLVAPELRGGDVATVATDVFGLGAMTYHVLTGDLPPSVRAEAGDPQRGAADAGLPAVRSVRSDVPHAVDDVLARATAPSPDQRHANVDDFVDEVVDALGARRRPRRRGGRGNGDLPSPYRGLHAFDESDAPLFFGRERLVDELLEVVVREPLVTVVGPSGSGKSSVVRAGLLPALRRGAVPGSERWFITTMRPGNDPIDALELALQRIAIEPSADIRDVLDERGGLLRTVRRIIPPGGTAVLVVDQFEELFTLVGSDEVRSRFLAELGHALSAPDAPVRIVATLRADHFDAPLRSPSLADFVHRGTVAVTPMQPEELQRAIVEPARSVGVDVEPALVAELVAGVTDQPAALPLLQFALTEVFERRVDDVMLSETHASLGGLTGALAARAERILEHGDRGDFDAVRRIFGRLVAHTDDAGVDLRRRALLAELGDDERALAVLDAFTAARLVVRGRDEATREPTVEVAHEALLRDWPRLAAWIEQDRDDVRLLHRVHESATTWEASGHDDSELARGGRLELAADLAVRRPELLTPLERSWIDRSRELAVDEAERDERHRRRLRRSVVATAVLAAVAVVAAVVALVLRSRAEANEQQALDNAALAAANEQQALDNAALAQRNEELARAREVILQAEQLLEDDPQLASLLAVEAIGSFRAAGETVPASATDLLRRAIVENRTVGVIPGGPFVDVSPDGTRIVTSGENGRVAVGDPISMSIETSTVGTSAIETYPPPPDGNLLRAGFWGDRVYAAVAIDEGEDPDRRATVDVLLATGDGTWEPLIRGVPDEGLWYRGWIGGDGRHFGARTGDLLRVWDVDVQSPIDVSVDAPVWSLIVDGATTFHMSGDGRLAYVAPGGAIEVVDSATGARLQTIEPPAEFTPQESADLELRFSEDGTRLALLEGDRQVVVYDLATGALLWSPVDLPRGDAVRWADQDSTLLVAGEAGLLRIDASTGQLDEIGSGGSPISDLATSGSGLVVAATEDGPTVVLDLVLRPGRDVVDSFTLPLAARWIQIARDGSRMTALGNEDAAVVDLESGDVRFLQRGLPLRTNNEVRDVNFYTVPVMNLDGSRFASPDLDGRSHLWDAESGERLWTAPDGWDIRAVANAGDRVVIARGGGVGEPPQARLVSTLDGSAVDLGLDDADVVRGVFAPDDSYVVASAGGLLGWSVPSGAPVDVAAFAETGFGFGDVSRDGRSMAFGLGEGTLALMDVGAFVDGTSDSAALRFTVEAARSFMNPIVISPDSTRIATVPRNEPIRIWSASDGAPIAEFDVRVADGGVGFHPTEPWVYVADGTDVVVHTLDVDQLLAMAATDAGRRLTDDECRQYLHRSCD